MKFKVWLDSGANIHSQYRETVTLEELGLTDEQWASMNMDQQDEIMREIAFGHSDWGYTEIEEDEYE